MVLLNSLWLEWNGIQQVFILPFDHSGSFQQAWHMTLPRYYVSPGALK